VDLVQIDVVELEPRERGVDRGEDVLAGEPVAVLASIVLPQTLVATTYSSRVPNRLRNSRPVMTSLSPPL